MSNSTTPPTPTVEDLDDLCDLAWNVLDRAIARFNETRTHAARTWSLQELDPTVNHWAELEMALAIDAEHHLVNCILASAPDANRFSACYLERFNLPPRGVRSGETTYLVVPDRDHKPGYGSIDGPPLMRLVVMEGNPIRDMGQAADFADLEHRPTQPPAPVELARPVWEADLLHAMETLGETESKRRIYGPSFVRKLYSDGPPEPGWQEQVLQYAREILGKDEAMRLLSQVPPKRNQPVWMLTVIKAAEDLGQDEALRRIFDVPGKPTAT